MIRDLIVIFAAVILTLPLAAQAKRLVLIKVDGLPGDLMERYMDRTDPQTGRCVLPWIHDIFITQGARVRNFYVRGISLSAPSWSMLDTGQHLAIRGNAEFDRFIPRVYDYLNFFPFYVGYARSKLVDMPGVEVLDQFGVPLLVDQFPKNQRYQSIQLFQRGVRWPTLGRSLRNRVVRPVREFVDEWQTGLEMSDGITQQEERELISAIYDSNLLYLDYYYGDYDHTAHLTADEASQFAVLKRLDAIAGRIWSAIQASRLASQTVLVMVSDHGMNSQPGVYSQGYNLVKFFNSKAGGGHHVITNRHPLTGYKLRGLNPFVSSVVTPSPDSFYLNGQQEYPTALLDVDGNERASVQLRNSDLNALQILLQQLGRADLDARLRAAVVQGVLRLIDANRAPWSFTVVQLKEELAALHRAIERQSALSAYAMVRDEAARRRVAWLETWKQDERGYSEYVSAIERLLQLKEPDLEHAPLRIESLLPPGVMGEPNSIHQLQDYVLGLSPQGLALAGDGALDFDRTFTRLNYLESLSRIQVRNIVQPALGASPIDFIAVRVAKDAVYVYGDREHQALLLSRMQQGTLWYRYLPVSSLDRDARGEVHFTTAGWAAGFPLRLFEDPALQISGDRAEWLNRWRPEREWFQAIHRTRYSNAIIGLNECFQRWQPESIPEPFRIAGERDWPLLRRFASRRREIVEPDMLILASDHWNFNVRGFNPGGNHGSFFRISTHSVLMAAGAGIPAGLEIDGPYDSLSLVPTLLSWIGRLPQDHPNYPGPLIELQTAVPALGDR